MKRMTFKSCLREGNRTQLFIYFNQTQYFLNGVSKILNVIYLLKTLFNTYISMKIFLFRKRFYLSLSCKIFAINIVYTVHTCV